ncbi:MAG: NfeD family protein, partial [Bacteroidota bacterium]|nr:NfeD family protein [Bacteroidota bacterium]
NVALLSTVGLSIIMFFLGKKMAQSQSLSLVEKEIKGRVNEQEHFEDVELGNTGVDIIALRPNGTIKINGNRFEAQAQNGYIQSGAHVTVVEIQHQKLIVQIVQE